MIFLLIYLLIGNIVFYKSTKAWKEDGYVWSKKWFMFCFIITLIAWPISIIKAIVLMMEYGAETCDKIITNSSEEIGIVEKNES